MTLDPHSPEFARLATRWLDGSATAVDAATLWEQILASKACAREFAEQARFELLLQDTLRERAGEAGIAAVARKKTVQHHRRIVQRQVFAIAAVLALMGLIVWLAIPGAPSVAKLHHEAVPSRPKTLPVTKPHRTTVLVAQSDAGAVKPSLPEPLKQRLDKFFLTSISLDKVPLHLALKQLEEQLRALNFANAADLAALRLSLPAEAAAREVTFHSGTIAFLKALCALASMVGCDVEVTDTSVALVTRPEPNPRGMETRTVEQLLAGLGSTADPQRDRMAELLHDARALGIEVSLASDGSGTVTGVKATRGQFEALALLAQARDQVRGLPPLSFYVQVTRAKPGDKDRILTEKETVDGRNDLLAADQHPPVITIPNLEMALDYGSVVAANGVQPDIVLTATPVGDGHTALSIDPSLIVAPTIARGSPVISSPLLSGPITAYVPSDRALELAPLVATATPGTIRFLTPSGPTVPAQGRSMPSTSTSSPASTAPASTGTSTADTSSFSGMPLTLNAGTLTAVTTQIDGSTSSAFNAVGASSMVGNAITLTPTGTVVIHKSGP